MLISGISHGVTLFLAIPHAFLTNERVLPEKFNRVVQECMVNAVLIKD